MRRAGFLIRAVLALALSACLALAVRAPAATPHASLEMADGTLSMSNSKSGAAILSASDLGPGDAATGSVTIANTGSVNGDFSLSSFGVTDVPGKGGGLLSTVLTATIVDVTDPAAPRRVYSGSLAGMTPRTLGAFAAGAEHTYSFTVGLDPAIRFDSVQGGAVTVGYRWTASLSPAGPGPGPTTTTTGSTPPPPPTDTTPTTTQPPPTTGLSPFKLTLTGPRSWSVRKRRGPAVTARCTRTCSLRATVKVRGARRKLALKVRSRPLAKAAGRATRFRIVVKKRSLRVVRRALRRHRKLKIAVAVKASDQYRLTASGRKLIRVKR
jgi:hypothetical protein